MNATQSGRNDLGDLADPNLHQQPLDVRGCDPATLKAQLRKMLLIRTAEQLLAAKRKELLIGGPVHLGVGQEAVAAGVSEWLLPTDKTFGGHRSHAHLLALGASVHGLFAEVLGKATGLSRGMGGSMHLWDGPRGFYGAVPIVAGTIPLAVGAGLAAKLKGTTDIGCAFFGDGAVEEGAAHESFNLARILMAPVLFVAENNLFASHMNIKLRQPSNSTARLAAAHGIETEVVDGNDVVAVSAAAQRLVARAREGKGPGYLEAVTFRWYGHVDWREDSDVGVDRSATTLAAWHLRDPIARLAAALERAGHWSAAEQASVTATLNAEAAEAWERAMADPWPPESATLDHVYAQRGAK